ncbi:MAG: EamA family transporter RarD, partial [Myxococcota bacterium]
FNVLLGALFLRERLRRSQMVAVLLAAAGVATLVIQSGAFPWISLTLAGSFALYGLVRKVTPVKPVVGMQLESLLLTPLAVVYLIVLAGRSELGFGATSYNTAMLIASGAVTAIPLIFFAEAAKRLTLTTVGFFQYIAPTLQFVLAVVFFGEPFSTPYAIAFGCIWSALALYSLDGHLASRLVAQTATSS